MIKNNKAFWSDWLFPIMSLVAFATLLAAMLWDMDTIQLGTLMSLASGILAYTMMLVVTYMASRPRYLEKIFGMPEMYEIHALMGMVLSILVIIHVIFQWNGFQSISDMSVVSRWGWVGVIGLLCVMFSGMFSISGVFVGRNKTMQNIKEKLNREVNLWAHRLSIIAIIAVYLHMYFIPYIQSNTVFMVLMTAYTLFSLGSYAWWRIKIERSKKFKVKKIYRGTPTLWVLEFEPVHGEIVDYTAGDYFFIRFKGDANITKEAHPFSTSSAITQRYNNSIEFMIKESGDWSGSLDQIKVGDVATLEGPYGNFLTPEVDNSSEEEVPYVLLAGGIGLTPCLSVLRHEAEKKSQREIHLVWGLSYEEDMFMVDELEEYKKVLPNFEYHIIFSNEDVEGYDKGFITDEYLRKVGSDHYVDGHFFVCGPPAMLNAARLLLDNTNVSDEQISLDDFGF